MDETPESSADVKVLANVSTSTGSHILKADLPLDLMKLAMNKIAAISDNEMLLLKSAKNQYGSYDYVPIDTFYAVVGPVMRKNGINLQPRLVKDSDVWDLKEKSVFVRIVVELHLIEHGVIVPDWYDFAFIHPLQGAQTMGSIMSYADKMAMRTIFKLATGETDADATDNKFLDTQRGALGFDPYRGKRAERAAQGARNLDSSYGERQRAGNFSANAYDGPPDEIPVEATKPVPSAYGPQERDVAAMRANKEAADRKRLAAEAAEVEATAQAFEVEICSRYASARDIQALERVQKSQQNGLDRMSRLDGQRYGRILARYTTRRESLLKETARQGRDNSRSRDMGRQPARLPNAPFEP